jgi:hypothetical protein
VSFVVASGELRVIGDGGANWVQISERPGGDGTGRTFSVVGRPFDGAFSAAGVPLAGTTPTTVNGGTAAVVRFAANDRVRILTGAGDDAVFFGTGGADSSTLGFVVNTGTGRDYVRVQRMAMNAVAAPISISTGNDTGIDNELVLLTQVQSAHGLTVNLGGGNDRLLIDNLSVQGDTRVNLGAGRDTITASSLSLNNVGVNAGTSNDRDVINVGFLQANAYTINMGAGNDLVNLTGPVGAFETAVINGGAGIDELRGGDNAVSDATLVSIEIDDIS